MLRRTKINLTELRVHDLVSTRGDRPQIYWDADLPGFGVLVSGKTGQKTYVVQRPPAFNDKGEKVQIPRPKIQRCNFISFDEAKKKAHELISLLDAGTDPKEKARQQREETRKQWEAAKAAESEAQSRGLTLRAAFDAYLESRKKLRPSSRRDYIGMMNRHLWDWMECSLCSITPDMVDKRHTQIATQVREGKRRSATTGQASANKVMRGLRAVWNNALLFRRVPGLQQLEPPTQHLSNADSWFDIPRRRTRVRDQDLPTFYAAAMRLDDTTARDLILTLLFTGLRVGEASALRWSYLDVSSRMITRPPSETKTGNQTQEPSIIPMSDFVLDLLRARERAGDYVFPGRPDRPISGAREALTEIGPAEEGEDSPTAKRLPYRVTHHDLRRTFASVASSVGIPQDVIGRLLNHAPLRTVTARYIVDEDPTWLLAPTQAVTNRLKALCGIALKLVTEEVA